MRTLHLNNKKREYLTGLFFATPFIIGSIAFFLYPAVTSLLLGFGDTDENRAGFHIVLTGFENFKRAFFTDTEFVPRLLKVIKNTLINTPLVIIFSLILAILLSKLNFLKGTFRVIVLLPFLLGSGEVMKQLISEGIDKQIIVLNDGNIIPQEFLLYLGQEIIKMIDLIFGRIVNILWSSGVQTLLFMSAIQNISSSLYESARIDGANEYDLFWKITLPMVSPILLLNTVYTIINSFSDSNNVLLEYIQQQTVLYAEHGFAAALGWIYFAFVLILLSLVYILIGNFVRKNQTDGRSKG